jgi:peroxiredoxin Q/BCP
MSELTMGDPAPDFRLQAADGSWVSLQDFPGEKVIVYFYPAAMTPACTVEAIDFTAAAPAFHQAGYQVIGISPDQLDTLNEFESCNHLDLILLSDPDRSVINAYGVWGDRMIYGKTIAGLIRSTFLVQVDDSGHGTVLEAQYGVRASGHVARLRQHLGL